MKASAKRVAYYSYPVELVWRSIGAGESRVVDSLTEEEFEGQQPEPNTVFTRVLEFEENHIFAFRMKARGFTADMRIELESMGPCETRMNLSETVEYNNAAVYIFSGFGSNIRKELRSFSMEINRRLADGAVKK